LTYRLFDDAAVEKWRTGPAESRLPDSRQSLPHICVPTTLSGAEFTYFTGVRNPASGLKETFVDSRLLPRTLIFDQLLCTKTPEQLWLSSGMRALDHAIEGLCSDRLHAFGKALALQGVPQLCESLAATKANPSDLDARKRSQFGAWFASIPLMSGVSMGASHAIGHAIGSLLNVPHGLTSCVILPAVMQFNYAAVPEQLEAIAVALGHADGRDAPAALREVIAGLGLPTRLSQIGVGSESFPCIVRGSLGEGWLKTNPRPIRSADDILEILTTAA
jgi:maleylacetate reductase